MGRKAKNQTALAKVVSFRKCKQCGGCMTGKKSDAKYCSPRCRLIAYKLRDGQRVKPYQLARADTCKYFEQVYIYNGRYRCVNWKCDLCLRRQGICSWNTPPKEKGQSEPDKKPIVICKVKV